VVILIKVEGLFHSYTKEKSYAVKDISFDIADGEVFGFLGPSGAGKSTTQGILTGILPLQKGKASVGEYDLKKRDSSMFNIMGVSFEQSNVYGKLTALENLEFYSKLFDVKTMDPMELLKLVGLDHVANNKANTFSKGMKHRLTFVRSMINNPKIWFLDEPTTGLDPSIASTIKNIIRSKNDEGATVFLTTHNMQVADELCDRVAFIIDGEIKLIDSPRNLKLQYGENLVNVEYVKNNEMISENLSLIIDEDKIKLYEIINNYKVETMHTKEATLEEIFIKVTGRGLQ
jgi:fluoroquinolone transport system ATP-binding protein